MRAGGVHCLHHLAGKGSLKVVVVWLTSQGPGDSSSAALVVEVADRSARPSRQGAHFSMLCVSSRRRWRGPAICCVLARV